jgi:hypothetical protein
MSVSGPCQICELRAARHACEQCGTLVCGEHYDERRALCADCVAAMGGNGGGQSGGSDDLLGDGVNR